jgi:hypothetical protein
MSEYTVCAVYRHTPDGHTALKYAADLFRRLGSGKLLVCMYAGEERQRALIADLLNGEPEARHRACIMDAVVKATGLSLEQVEVAEVNELAGLPARTILVDHDGVAADVSTLVPFDESAFDARGTGSIMIPFGTDESAMRAASMGIELAAKLGRKILFYHTTWPNKDVAAAEPHKHMCARAVSTGERLAAAATVAGVEHRTVVETALDVVLGTLRCAVRENVSLIVMAREPKIIRGSYVDRTLAQSMVPMLVVSAESARRLSC